MRIGRIAAGGSLLSLGLMLAACGGGGGVVSTPTPGTPTPAPATPTPTPATPTPTPAATNQSLENLVASQSFTNDAVTSSVKLDSATLNTIAASHSPATLQISFNVATGSYTVTGAAESAIFGNADRITPAITGQTDYRKQAGSVTQYFTLTSPASPVNLDVRYVGGAYWQRNRQAGNELTIDFDVATYGITTPDAAVPRSGTAGYEVNLFGFMTPLNRTPKVISGDGTFLVDFAHGAFFASGGATEIDLTDPYWTGTHNWRAAGNLSSSADLFSGGFTFDGRDRFTVSGTIQGRFYGPQAQELGAVFDASDKSGAIMVGTLLGAKSASVVIPPLTVLNTGGDRSFYGPQTLNAFMRRLDSTSGEGAAANVPGSTARIDFGADGSVRYNPLLSSGELPGPIFTAADLVAVETNARYTTYTKTVNGVDYRLVLYNPGPGNTELELTYTSFARWDRVEVDAIYERRLDDWLTYGIATPSGVLPNTGNASYSMIIRGSGYVFANSARYDVTGNATMQLNFATSKFTGNFAPIFTPVTNGGSYTLGVLTYAGELNDVNAFQAGFAGTVGRPDGEIRGYLYGPLGEEIGASWQVFQRNDGGSATAEFAGVAVGKKN